MCVCLDDPELPVRIQAALALTELITSHDSGRVFTLPDVTFADDLSTYSEGGRCSSSRQGHPRSVIPLLSSMAPLTDDDFRLRPAQDVRRYRP